MKISSKKKLFGLLALMLTGIFVLAACGGGGGTAATPTPGTPGQETTAPTPGPPADVDLENIEPAFRRFADEPITLDWLVVQGWIADVNESLVAQRIFEETGIRLNLIDPGGMEAEVINTMVAAGTLPDIISISNVNLLWPELIEAGLVLPLNELANRYDPYFWNVAQPDTVMWYTMDDGNIFRYPNYSITFADVEQGFAQVNPVFMVAEDIYEALGRPDMTYPEGFLQALRDARDMFPERNGFPLIPLGVQAFGVNGNQSLDLQLMDFLAVPRADGQGNMLDRHLDEEWQNWLRVIRQVVEEGMFDVDAMVDTSVQINERIAQGRYFALMSAWTALQHAQDSLLVHHPEMALIPTHGPRNSNGAAPRLDAGHLNGWVGTAITSNVRDAERAMSLITYMLMPETQVMLAYGPEGIGFNWIDGEAVPTDWAMDLLENNAAYFQQHVGGMQQYFMLRHMPTQARFFDPVPQVALRPFRDFALPMGVNVSPYVVSLAEAPDIALINQNVNLAWGETLPQLLLASSDEEFDRMFAEWIERRYNIGFGQVLEEQTRQHRLNLQRLGIDY